ncbi:MAG: SoxR reducing system RseC family protein [Desulfobacteraceae bacterium]
MAIEQGIVIKVGLKGRNIALVKTIQHSGCEACSAREQCNPSAKGKAQEVEAVNLVNAKPGDLIQISLDTRALLQATFLLYIFPIICMLFGAFVGNTAGAAMGMAPSTVSLLMAIACFAAAMYMVRKRAGRMALKRKYQPKITRILGRAKPSLDSGCEAQASISL